MERNFIYVSESGNGHENLAVDEWFLDHVSEGDTVLHLYQNSSDIIIGKNQNPWLECDLEAMKRDGVRLVRRVSGGGAVYHDSGNLNFSFISSASRYDTEKYFSLIASALRRFGIETELSGRNDLICNGKKFSGNAFAARKNNRQHHGTLLVSADLGRLSSYLTVDPLKIRSKGISSVRSRVCNLTELCPSLTVSDLKKSLLRSFEEDFGYYAEWQFSPSEQEKIARYVEKHSSEAWYLGESPKFDFEWKNRFSWGNLQLLISVEKGRISAVSSFSDSMDPEISSEVQRLLPGCSFSNEGLSQAFAEASSEELRSLSQVNFLDA